MIDTSTPATGMHAELTCSDVEAILADAQDEIARLNAIVTAKTMEIEILRAEKTRALRTASN